MIYDDSYKTVIGSAFNTKNIELAIKECIIKDQIDYVNLNVNKNGKFIPIFITGIFGGESKIPLFTHPLAIFNFNHKNYLCTDLRLFIRDTTTVSEVENNIKNRTEYNFAKSRAILNLLWLNDDVLNIKNTLSFASGIFSAWLADVISKAYALDYKDRTTISIITSFYYQTLFENKKVFDEESKQKMAVHTINVTKSPGSYVLEVFDQIQTMEDIEDYCRNISTIVENVRLKVFNLAVLLTIIKSSWYGTNAKEILSIALEHPPTWSAIVYTALNERSYKNSIIYRLAEQLGKRGLADEFLMQYRNLVKSSIVATEELVIRDFE